MNRQNYRKLKPELLKKFNNQCVYCGIKFFEPTMASIEHFYPKSLYPDLVNDSNNLLIACRACNNIKGNKSPIDEDGNLLLINPAKEKFSDHMIQLENGYLEGTTELGQTTIDILQLNRDSLIEQRILDMIDMKFDDNIKLSNSEIYKTYENSIKKINDLNLLELQEEKDLEEYMKYMLYSNVITSLETYLCDRFVALVQNNNKHLRNFVQTFHGFKNEKFSINEVFRKYDDIENEYTCSNSDSVYMGTLSIVSRLTLRHF